MSKKFVWTVELPDSDTRIGALYSAIHRLGGKVKGGLLPLADDECFFWVMRSKRVRHKVEVLAASSEFVMVFKRKQNGIKFGTSRCRKDDTYNVDFGIALAAARCLNDRKLERALLRFSPEQIDMFF